MKVGWAIRGAAGVLIACSVAACAPPPPPHAPFRVQPFGAGLDPESGGRRLILADEHGTVANYRVRPDSLRIYDPNADQLGRIRVAASGFELVTITGEVFCTLSLEDPAVIVCGDRDVSLTQDGPFVLQVNGETVGSLHAEDRWRFRYTNRPYGDIEETDAGVSVPTHDDARRWFRTAPFAWHAAPLVMSQVDVPGFEADELTLIRGALAFVMAHHYAAEIAPASPPSAADEGSGTPAEQGADTDAVND